MPERIIYNFSFKGAQVKLMHVGNFIVRRLLNSHLVSGLCSLTLGKEL